MKLTNTDIIFASLMGNKSVKTIANFNVVQNQLAKHVLPPIPFLPLKKEVNVEEATGFDSDKLWQVSPSPTESQQFFPFSFEDEKGVKWLLPYEPMLSINGGNTIIRRNVAKAKPKTNASLTGSIKERWNQKDYEITITGVLIGSVLTGDVSDCFPRKDFEKLRDIMTAPQRLKVFCEPLQLLNIHYLVIESFSFPFTKGENVQAYEIKAFSDFDYKLLLDIED